MIKKFTLLALLTLNLPGCSGAHNADEYIGTWKATDASGKSREISLLNNGKFIAKSIPSSMICSSRIDPMDLDGSGIWEYQPEYDRIFATLTEVSSQRCSVPYGFMIIAGPGNTLSMNEDVDNPSTAITFLQL